MTNHLDMSTNKKAFVRYMTLDRCFANRGRFYTIKDLLQACNEALSELYPNEKGISERQLYDDIAFMESTQGWSIPLDRIKDGRYTYYRYSDPDFSINRRPLTMDELNRVKAAMEVLTHFIGLPQFEWIYEILPILSDRLGVSGPGSSRPVIDLHSNRDFTGLKYIDPFYQAIVNEVVLEVTYQSFDKPVPETFYYHPYYLKEYNNRWFVFGFNEAAGKHTWNLALDRVVDIKQTTRTYEKFEFDWESFFYDIVGVTRYDNAELQTIELIVYPESAPYVYHKPLHPSQRARFEGDRLRVTLKVIPNRELIQLILTYGKNIEVVSPASLRQIISQELAEACRLYSTDKK